MAEYTCPWCAEHPDLHDECWHKPQEYAIAEALRDAVDAHFRGEPWGTRVDMAGAFLDDAEGLYPEVGEPPYSVELIYPPKPDRWTAIGLVNRAHLFVMPNEEGDAAAEYLGDISAFLGPQTSDAGPS